MRGIQKSLTEDELQRVLKVMKAANGGTFDEAPYIRQILATVELERKINGTESQKLAVLIIKELEKSPDPAPDLAAFISNFGDRDPRHAQRSTVRRTQGSTRHYESSQATQADVSVMSNDAAGERHPDKIGHGGVLLTFDRSLYPKHDQPITVHTARQGQASIDDQVTTSDQEHQQQPWDEREQGIMGSVGHQGSGDSLQSAEALPGTRRVDTLDSALGDDMDEPESLSEKLRGDSDLYNKRQSYDTSSPPNRVRKDLTKDIDPGQSPKIKTVSSWSPMI